MYFRENKSLNGKPKRLRSNAYEKKKATIIVVANSIKEERSSEVQTTSGLVSLLLKKTNFYLNPRHCEAMRMKMEKPRL